MSIARIGELTGGVPALIATTFEPFVPAQTDDFYLARLPFEEAQAALGALGARAGTAVLATCGWHGTGVMRDRGSFAVVNLGGALEGLLGARVRVGVQGGSEGVYAFVSDMQTVGQDITVTRRLFQQLAPLGARAVKVTVEVVPRA